MSKMNELSQVLDELIRCGNGMVRAAEALRAMYSAEEAQEAALAAEAAAETAPKTAGEIAEEYSVPAYSFMDVRKAFSAKVHEGYAEQVKAIIASYGAAKLSDIKEEAYASLMSELEAIS